MQTYQFKRAAKVLIDALLFALSLIIAYKLRLEHEVAASKQNWFIHSQLPFMLSIVMFVRVGFLFLFQTYNKMWRYTELNEVLELIKPILCSSLLLAIPRLIGFNATNQLFAIPLSVIFIDTIISLILLSSARLVRRWQISNRVFNRRMSDSKDKPRKKTVLIGAGTAGNEVARKINQHPELEIDLICALDDDERKKGNFITKDLKVVGKINDLNLTIEKYNIDQILIAIPSLSSDRLREIVELCNSLGIETTIIPGVDQLAGGQITIEQIRKVSLEDLLGREPVDLSIPEVANFINGKTILITGAGGSIGSELARQLLKNGSPKKLYLLGRGENSIFNLTQDLKRLLFSNYHPIICDIRNYKSLFKHIEKVNPDVIFHAAAHKHVPLMEDHPQEAFENNTIGTKNVAEIAGKLNIPTMVNISTDKAVNPVNVLGCTKRLAELVIVSMSEKYPSTKYVSVRFGNVIGSRGSVIPIWEYQLKNNQPITVTSKDVYRYFMTIPEAAQLVIKAGAIGKPAEILVLDMGKEINIYKLAKDFISLSGFDGNNADLIKVTGLRPGEKLREELIGYYEGTSLTNYKKIMVIEPAKNSKDFIDSKINDLTSKIDVLAQEDYRKLLVKETEELNKSEQKTAGII